MIQPAKILLSLIIAMNTLLAQETASERRLIGHFSDVRSHEETGDVTGTAVLLYQDGEKVFGQFTSAEGSPRDCPIENATFDTSTGKLYFECWFSSGIIGTDTGWEPCQSYVQAMGIVSPKGLALKYTECVFSDDSKFPAAGWTRDFIPTTEKFLPIDNSDYIPKESPSYFAWARGIKFPTPSKSKICTPETQPVPIHAKQINPSLSSYSYWSSSINLPVIILLLTSFFLGSVTSWVMIRISRTSA